MRFALLFFLFLTGAVLPDEARAEIIPVEPGKSVQAALDRATAGDTVRLAPGVHRARVVFKNSGVHDKPIVLEGAPGAILDGSENVPLNWQAAPDVAPGAYRAGVRFPVFTLTANARIVTMLREDRVKPGATEKDKEGNLWDWTKLFPLGVGSSKWEGVKALALYLEKPGKLLVRFKDDLDPRQMTITVAPREPIVKISSANRCVVRGLTLRNGAYGVFIEDSLGSVVENCIIGPTDHGVWLNPGADRCIIRFNEMFMNPYAGADPKSPGAWDNWMAHKRGGHYDRFGVQIYKTQGGPEIHDNYIHDQWDGIEDRGTVGENRGLRIHHNRIFNVSDDGLEPNGAEEDCHWNNNIVERSIAGFRIKAPTHGPLYAYRNIFFDNTEDYRNYGEVELKPAKVFIYHNTSTARSAIHSNKVFGIGTPNYHYFNNLFWCEYWWGNTGVSVPPNWKGDYNVYARRGANPRWEETRAIAAQQMLDGNSLWTQGNPGFISLEKRDVSLATNSPARGRGIDLHKLPGIALPGLPPGPAPDAGALQWGEAMPQLPRRPQDVNASPAGTWPGPEAEVEKKKLNALLPVLKNSGFENGLDGWNQTDASSFEIKAGAAAEGEKYLKIKAAKRTELVQKIVDLVAGQPYILSFWARGSTFTDARIILRNPTDDKYLSTVSPAKSVQWTKQTLRFLAPGPFVGLEISLRSAGTVDLDGFEFRKNQ